MNPFTDGQPLKFAIEKVEMPLVFIGGLIFKQFPTPTKKNTYKHDTHVMIDLRDWFFNHRKKDSRYEPILGLFNFLISKMDRDDYYADILKVLIREIKTKDWELKLSNNFKDYWEE
jgi:hypothetical protein